MGRKVDVIRRSRLTAGRLRQIGSPTRISCLARAIVLLAGLLSTALPANARNFNVGNETQLQTALNPSGGAQDGDTITFTANIILSTNLPEVKRDVTINGANHTLSGNKQHRGLFVQSGKVAINDLVIENAKAQGGNGGNGVSPNTGDAGGGGGGAGLGGALFVASGARVTVSNVTLLHNTAQGGVGGAGVSADGKFAGAGGGGGGMFGNGGIYDGTRAKGGPGGGGIGGGPGPENGGPGVFGGGGGLGGAIFVQYGGELTVAGHLDIFRNSVAGGNGGGGNASPGQGIGSGILFHGNGSFTVAPGAGQTQLISDTIADQTGGAGSGGNWAIVKNGAGTTILDGATSLSGGGTVNEGVLEINALRLAGNITNKASLVFAQTIDGAYTGNLSGSGSLIKTGTGDLTLSGTNTYAGGTTVNGGALLFTTDASLGAAGIGINLNNGTIGSVATVHPGPTSNRPVTITDKGGFSVASAPLTWSGVIGGSGQLTKSGDGDLILSAANTYGGGTTVTGGVLRFTNDVNLGAAGTAITLNGGAVGTTKDTPAATSIDRKIVLAGNGGIDVALHPFIWSGSISGGGRLIKSGDGEFELTGTNTYSGGTLVQRGTLRVASDDKLGATGTGLTLENNAGLRASETFTSTRNVLLEGAGGVFLVDPGKTLTLNGIVGGSGNLTKVGDGTLILTGANSYAGNIFNNGGAVQGNTTNLRGNIIFDPNANNPIARSITFDQATNGTFAGNITGLGSLTKTGAGALTLGGNNTYTEGTTVSAGILQGAANSLQGRILNDAAVIFDQGVNGTYAGAMTGTGTLTKNGAGKLTLTGTSTVGGGTTINTGGLAVNVHLTSNVTLNKGGILSGVGNITGNITNNGGTIEPGNSIGNITIDGNLTWNSGTFDVEISPSASDRITIVGAGHKATVHAGTLDVVPLPGIYVPDTTYTIVSAPAGGIATFNDVTADFAFLRPVLSFDLTSLYLSLILAPDAFRSAGQTSNQRAVGGVLDAAAAGGNFGGIVGALSGLPTAQGTPALQALSGEIAAGAIIAGIDSADRFLAVFDG
ncbi:hypothetical protein FJ984_29885, partial [Mesorhizobium sp. B1-1-3]|uniref:autotransporter-associated beta strand repeat-containing protein n=1 Tax=Mesorhizobium sp. B1-1-3 TaxID=2589981 RepID=UPI00116FB3DB